MTTVYQEEVLNAADCCSNCFCRQRRDAIQPTSDGDVVYSERLRWQTTVEDVPDTVAHDSGRVFCRCGAEKHHTRIWADDDVDRGRLRDLLVALLRTLAAKGYRVDERRVAEVAVAHYETLRSPEYGPFQDPTDYDTKWRRTPDGMNDVFAAAIDAGVSEPTRPSASTD